MRFSELTRPELESIIESANFTEEELIVFKMLTKGKTITEIAQKTNACNRTVSRRIEKMSEMSHAMPLNVAGLPVFLV